MDVNDLKGLFAEVSKRMHAAIEHLQHEFAGVRTGRASVTILDGVHVEAYGSKMPLNQMAGLSVPEPTLILAPAFPWEMVQIGNCGSPIETEAGWLVLSHGVGPMRQYSIGAFLLDRDDPVKVIGRLREPLLKPTESERQGYVPNVVYTCGGLVHAGELIIPYAYADHATGFATVPLDVVLGAMR